MHDTIFSTWLTAGPSWANLAGAAFNSYPTTGSFARSAVAKYAGAKTGLAGVVTAGLVGIALLLLTPVFNGMPMNALAAIVIAGVLPLLDFGKGVSLFWVSAFLSLSLLNGSAREFNGMNALAAILMA